jgi:hypothetical protein
MLVCYLGTRANEFQKKKRSTTDTRKQTEKFPADYKLAASAGTAAGCRLQRIRVVRKRRGTKRYEWSGGQTEELCVCQGGGREGGAAGMSRAHPVIVSELQANMPNSSRQSRLASRLTRTCPVPPASRWAHHGARLRSTHNHHQRNPSLFYITRRGVQGLKT